MDLKEATSFPLPKMYTATSIPNPTHSLGISAEKKKINVYCNEKCFSKPLNRAYYHCIWGAITFR